MLFKEDGINNLFYWNRCLNGVFGVLCGVFGDKNRCRGGISRIIKKIILLSNPYTTLKAIQLP